MAPFSFDPYTGVFLSVIQTYYRVSPERMDPVETSGVVNSSIINVAHAGINARVVSSPLPLFSKPPEHVCRCGVLADVSEASQGVDAMWSIR